jgi:predicted DNA-binding transcriptional regulator AlpA
VTAERFWSAPEQTRVGAEEIAEATGRSRAAVYKMVSRDGCPARRLPDRTLVFVCGEVREWLKARETLVNLHVARFVARRVS